MAAHNGEKKEEEESGAFSNHQRENTNTTADSKGRKKDQKKNSKENSGHEEHAIGSFSLSLVLYLKLYIVEDIFHGIGMSWCSQRHKDKSPPSTSNEEV